MSPLVLLCIALHLIDASVIPPLLSHHHLLSGGRHGDRNYSNSIRSLNAETEVDVTLPETSTGHAVFGDDNDEIGQSRNSVKVPRFHDGTTNHFDTSINHSLSPTTQSSNDREHHHKHRENSGDVNGEKV